VSIHPPPAPAADHLDEPAKERDMSTTKFQAAAPADTAVPADTAPVDGAAPVSGGAQSTAPPTAIWVGLTVDAGGGSLQLPFVWVDCAPDDPTLAATASSPASPTPA
jgi:hypothetical protein